METAQADPGANASQDSPETVETVTETVIEEERPRRYELEPEPESKAESPPADDDNVDEKTPEQGDPRKVAHDRINELTKNWRQTEKTAAELAAENEELRRRLSQTGPPPEGQPPGQPIQSDDIPERKTLADFDYDDAAFMQYMEDRTEKIIERRTSEAFHKQQAAVARNARTAEHRTREQEFAGATEDYWPTVQQVPVTQEMLGVVESSDVGPELLYYLGKNQDVAAGLVQANPIEMARRVTLMEVEIRNARSAASQKAVSKAPPPTEKVKAKDPGIRVAPSDPKSDKLSDDEWFKRRQKEVEASRRR